LTPPFGWEQVFTTSPRKWKPGTTGIDAEADVQVSKFNFSKHLTDDELFPAHSACVFCGSQDLKHVHTFQDDPEVALRECAACHASTASRIPRPDALDTYYGSYYEETRSGEGDSQTTMDNLDRFCAHLTVGIQKNAKRPIRRVLDFGGGDGSISYGTCRRIAAATNQTIEIDLVDFDRIPLKVDEREGVQLHEFTSLDDVRLEAYDLVLASGVIEHLPNPQEITSRLLGLVEPGGLFYARTPWMLPLQKAVSYFGIRIDFAFPGHIHDLGGDFWRTYFASDLTPADFRICYDRPSPVETGLRRGGLVSVCAHLLKAPWFLLGSRYKLVGGWEVFVTRCSD
jgi:SAM-dependent methyltransferase